MSSISLDQMSSRSYDKERAVGLLSNDSDVGAAGATNHHALNERGLSLLEEENAVGPSIADGGTRAWMSVAGGYVDIFFGGCNVN